MSKPNDQLNTTELASILGIQPSSVVSKLRKEGIEVVNGSPIGERGVLLVAETYSKKYKNRPTSRIRAAKAILGDAVVKKKVMHKQTSKKLNIFQNKSFIVFVLIVAMIWQMIHNSILVMRVDDISILWISVIGSVLFAFSVQFTALICTINSGNKSYLIAFAFIEYLINTLYYDCWSGTHTWSYVFTTQMISITIAFTIYSYADLFSRKIIGE